MKKLTLLLTSLLISVSLFAQKTDTAKVKPMPPEPKKSGYVFNGAKSIVINLCVPFTVKSGDLDTYIWVNSYIQANGLSGPEALQNTDLPSRHVKAALAQYQAVINAYAQPILDSLNKLLVKRYNEFVIEDTAAQKRDSIKRANVKLKN